MTKIGEGKEIPEQPSLEQYHRELELNASKFLNALEGYKDADSGDERVHLKAIMDQSLELIKAAVNEIKRAGIYKQEVKVENDYRIYISSNNPDDLMTLEEDLSTLRDYNKLS